MLILFGLVTQFETKVNSPATPRNRPDLSPMTNFEIVPQLGTQGGDLPKNWKMRQFLMSAVLKSDGWIVSGTPELEPESTKLFPELLGMPVYSVG